MTKEECSDSLTEAVIIELCYLISHKLNVCVTYRIELMVEDRHICRLIINDEDCASYWTMGDFLIGDDDLIVGGQEFNELVKDTAKSIFKGGYGRRG